MRCLACTVLRAAGCSYSATLLLSGLLFGLIHVPGHYRLGSGTPLLRVLTSALPQFVMTAVFGAVASVMFLNTGTFVAPFVAHALANWLVTALPDPQLFTPGSATAAFRGQLLLVWGAGLVLFALALPLIANAAFFAPGV
jgi:membrane protease YdiL (CAAX protease family)